MWGKGKRLLHLTLVSVAHMVVKVKQYFSQYWRHEGQSEFEFEMTIALFLPHTNCVSWQIKLVTLPKALQTQALTALNKSTI